MTNKTSGFTLVEVIVAMVILSIGLLALATVAYYRSGTLALAALADAHATAVFGVAAGIAMTLLWRWLIALPRAVLRVMARFYLA